MALYYRDLLDLIMQRADRIGLVDQATQKADAVELELYMFHALLSIVELFDLNDYTVRSSQIVSTESGVDTYVLPTNYGRLIAPRVRNRRGIYLRVGSQDVDLEYVDPNVFVRQEQLLPRQPSQFTVMRREISLAPVPDAVYRVHGLYIEQTARPDLDDPVPLSHPTVLIDEAIYTLASDMGRLNEAIVMRRNQALAKLISAPVGNADRIARG